MKKTFTLFLAFILAFSMVSPAYAAAVGITATSSVVHGTILRTEACVIGGRSIPSVVSYEENSDGSFTFYQYRDGILIEEHSTLPGSGIVDHTFYSEDGSFIQQKEYTLSKIAVASAATNIPDSVSERDMGYMHYLHPMTQTIYSIHCTVRDGFFNQRPYTIHKDAAKNLADWTATLLSAWAFLVNPAAIISLIIDFVTLTGLLQRAANGIYTAMFTRTVVCSYNNQEFTGLPTAPSTAYPSGYLEGTYVVVKENGQTKVITEGFTVRQWGEDTFGRMMMYQVFGIDESPTGWTNVD